MRKILFLLLFLPSLIFAQTDYNQKFKEVILDIEKNYAGFRDKTENQKEIYNIFRENLLNDSLTSLVELKNHVNPYINFFNDSHLYSYSSFYDENVAKEHLKSNHNDVYQFKVLNNNTCYLKIGSFANKEFVDKLIANNIETISVTQNLIIDIRDNGGGGDAAFWSLLPLIATNHIYLRNVEFLATPRNWEFMSKYANMDNWNPENEDKFIQAPWINNNSMFTQAYNHQQTERYPKRIAVLVNKVVGSAAEQFVFATKQSFKVKVFGENTRGAFDYSNCRHFEVVKDSLYISSPTTKTHGLPKNRIDGHGIVPDFYLGPENQVEQILRYFEYWY